MTCGGCGRSLAARRRQARYCSSSCRAAASRQRRLESARAVSAGRSGAEATWTPDPEFYRPASAAWRLLGCGPADELEDTR